jgi:L-seryl-tRNA(Ser) seleniumtransferase
MLEVRMPEDSGTAPDFRAIPSVTVAMEHVRMSTGARVADEPLTSLVQRLLAAARNDIAEGKNWPRQELLDWIVSEVDRIERARLEPTINATGVIVHTNLGRAPVSPEAASAMADAASHYVPLEVDPERGIRGDRMREISDLMRILTGAESTLVVNNNAAAVLLTLSALAYGREVIVSRGEAVEIGGGFRIPDVMRQSGARLVEVGTTNRTYARDYRNAISESTAVILAVHPSNFRIEGFTHAPDLEDLVAVGLEGSVPVVDDLGSGSLIDVQTYGLAYERTIPDSLATGVAIATASGDKLLGGPQAGIICGRADLVQSIERHPLARAVRADKASLAGIAATLRHYLHGDAAERVPIWRMIGASEESLRIRATALRDRLSRCEVQAEVVECRSTVGGGSLPGETLPSACLLLAGASADDLARRLRVGAQRVFGRIHDDRLYLDLRTVLPEDDDHLVQSILDAM